MSIVLATCDDHGDVEMTSDDVTLRICNDNNRATFIFRCPEGHEPVVKDANKRAVELLEESGCKIERWDLPKELDERKDGPDIEHDDLLDFHRLIEDDARFMDVIAEIVKESNFVKDNVVETELGEHKNHFSEGEGPNRFGEGSGFSPESRNS